MRKKQVIKDKAAWRETQIVELAYLVKQVASSFARRLPSSVIFDELVSAGSLGLIDAVDKYDSEKDVTLKTYAQHRIRGAILDELRSMDSYSRSMRKKIQDIAASRKRVEDAEGRPATDEEVAREMGVNLDVYDDMVTQIHGATLLRLDAFIKTQSNDTPSKTRFMAGLKGSDTPSGQFDKAELKAVLAKIIGTLKEKEQLVVSLYYYEELTLKEIGEVLSLTESRICQIHTAVLNKLHTRLKTYFNG